MDAARYVEPFPGIRNSLNYALSVGDLEQIRAILATGKVHFDTPLNERGLTAIHSAASHFDPRILQCILALGGGTGKSLYLAFYQVRDCQRNDSEDGRLEVKSVKGFTPLHMAAETGLINNMKLLLDHGADADARTNRGNTPLHLAALRNSPEAAMLLLQYNASPNAIRSEGWTALHLAAIYDRVEVAQFLVRNRIDVDALDDEGRTALSYAATDKTRRLLLDASRIRKEGLSHEEIGRFGEDTLTLCDFE